MSVFLSIIGALQLFDIVWVTTKGGPIGASSTMATYLYDQFRKSLFGYASAVSIVIFVLSLVVALLYQRFALRRDLQGDWSRWLSSASLPTSSAAARAKRRRWRLDRLGLYVVAMFVLGIIILPLTFSVLGGFRTNRQLVEQPGRSAQPVGVRELHQHPVVELVLASGVEQHVHRARPRPSSCCRRHRWPRS